MIVLVTRRVKAGKEREFEDFLERVRTLAAAHGSRGMTVIPPPNGSGEYAIVYRFADAEQLAAWRFSAARAALIAESYDLAESPPLERDLTGLDGWFARADGLVVRPPPRWKTWFLTLAALYVLLLTITTIAEPLLAPLAPPLRFALVLPVLSALMTWVVMPRLSRLLARWLYD